MPDTEPNIPIPHNTWINLYDASELPVGTVIAVQNIGVTDVYLSSSRFEPSEELTAYCVLQRSTGQWFRNEEGDVGAWAYCLNAAGLLAVLEV